MMTKNKNKPELPRNFLEIHTPLVESLKGFATCAICDIMTNPMTQDSLALEYFDQNNIFYKSFPDMSMVNPMLPSSIVFFIEYKKCDKDKILEGCNVIFKKVEELGCTREYDAALDGFDLMNDMLK